MSMKIDAWQSSDGTVFVSERECDEYEQQQKLTETIKRIVGHFFYTDMPEQDIVAGIIEALPKIKAMLQ